jgi:hypothetical protein
MLGKSEEDQDASASVAGFQIEIKKPHLKQDFYSRLVMH